MLSFAHSTMYKFISCMLVNLKRAIDSENTILLDKPIKSTRTHHEEAPELILTSTNKIG